MHTLHTHFFFSGSVLNIARKNAEWRDSHNALIRWRAADNRLFLQLVRTSTPPTCHEGKQLCLQWHPVESVCASKSAKHGRVPSQLLTFYLRCIAFVILRWHSFRFEGFSSWLVLRGDEVFDFHVKVPLRSDSFVQGICSYIKHSQSPFLWIF